MDISQRLFTPPWKLIGGSKLLWYARLEALRSVEAEAAHIQQNRASGVDQLNAKRRR